MSFDNYCTYSSAFYPDANDPPLENGYTVIFNGSGALVVELTNELEGHYEFDLDYSFTSDDPALPPSMDLSQSMSCSFFSGAENFDPDLDCTVTINYAGEDQDYVATDLIVSGNNTSGYDLSLTVVDESNQEFSASFSDLTVCANGNFGSGTGTIDYNNASIDVEYIDCDTMVISYRGNSETRDQ